MLVSLLPQAVAFAWYCVRGTRMASSTTPDIPLVIDLVIRHVACTILPILKSHTLLSLGLLRTDTYVLILPHAAVPVVGMIRASINHATRDLLPAALRANEVPCGGTIDGTAY